jgi:hypothetical protein
MPFPYTVPIKKWIKDILIEREKNPNSIGFRMPFIVLTSSAIVIKGNIKDIKEKDDERLKELGSILETGSITQLNYRGCILTNRLDIPSMYQTNETIVGYDFSGKPIKVEGESNRRISTPIIEGLEIDTDGAGNTLKTARISIKCFSLKQLEMFELFFLKPTLTLLLEFGDSSLLRNPNLGKIESSLIKKDNFESFVEDLSNFLVASNKTIQQYYKKSEESRGSYDFMVGKVTGYTYSIEESGIYTISLEISSGNQFTLAMPIHTSTNTSSGNTPANANPDIYDQTINQMISDFDLNADKFKTMLTSKLPTNKKDWKDDFFNFGKLNVKEEDETVSIKPYVSLRFILKILMNYSTDSQEQFEFRIPKYKVGPVGAEKEIEFIPAQSHKNLISSSELILFPGNIPTISTGSGADYKEIVFNPTSIQDCIINGYSYNETSTINRIDNENFDIRVGENDVLVKLNPTNNYQIANLLNCFILYSEVVQLWRKSFTRLDFIEQILRIINQNTYGLNNIRTGVDDKDRPMTLIDYKLTTKSDSKIFNENNVYRFKPGSVKSTVKNFTFSMELSDMIAARSAFGTQAFFSDALIKKELKDSKAEPIETILNNKLLQSVDMHQYTSYDGFYSVDKIAYLAAKKVVDKTIRDYKTNTTQQSSEPATSQDDVTKANSYDTLIKSKIKSFRKSNDPKSAKMSLIFLNSGPIIRAIAIDVSSNTTIKPTLSPIEISVTIDGISGLSSGEYFYIDGVPETYNRDGVFEIQNIKHSVTNEGWFTTLDARYRYYDKTK